REFLNRQELHVIEQRYGLNDPLFRPQMKRRTLAEIAGEMRGGLTRERARQVEESAVGALRARLPSAVADAQQVFWANRIQDCGCVVASAELSAWRDEPQLGGYQ